MSGLPADLGRLLETKQGADVDFEVCGKVFAAHKLVLAARSSVFMADFFGPAKEKATGGGHIRICDMHPDAATRSRPCCITCTPTRCRRR